MSDLLANDARTRTAAGVQRAIWDETKAEHFLRQQLSPVLESISGQFARREIELARQAAKSFRMRNRKAQDDSLMKRIAGGLNGAVQSALGYLGKLAKGIGAKIRAVAAAAIIAVAGDPHAVVRKVQDEAFTELVLDRGSQRAARNVVWEAANGGTSEAVKELTRAGAVKTTIWMSCRDNRVRKTHRRADGQKKSSSGTYVVGGCTCEYPRDPALPAEERDECRCQEVAVYNNTYGRGS
jgi:hypothetical protein